VGRWGISGGAKSAGVNPFSTAKTKRKISKNPLTYNCKCVIVIVKEVDKNV
jgi:hypothetical protein